MGSDPLSKMKAFHDSFFTVVERLFSFMFSFMWQLLPVMAGFGIDLYFFKIFKICLDISSNTLYHNVMTLIKYDIQINKVFSGQGNGYG